MPMSVVIALVATGLMVLFSAVGGIGQISQGELPVSSIFSLAIGVIILLGIAKGHRLAYQWGRILVGLAAFFYTLGLVGGGFALFALANNPDGLLGPGDPVVAQDIDLRTAILVGIAVLAGFVLLMWIIFFSLGTKSARRYFQLVCPSCGHTKVKANDFFFNRGKCKRCGVIW